MSISDAVLHSFSTLSLGGLSTHDASFAFFNAPAIEWVAIVFMTLASCNFALYFVALYRGSLASIFHDGEFRVTLIILLGFGTFCFIYLVLHGVVEGGASGLRTVLFNVISIASTTGYSSTDYTQWPLIIPMLMILMSGASTSAGSTGAGLKVIRLVVLFQQIGRELRKSVHKRLVDPVRVSGSPIDNKTVFSILVFVCIYGVSVLVVSLLFVASGLAFDTSFSASLAMINNMGPGLNEIGPSGNYAGFTSFQLWISSVAMILGRIEFLSFLVLLSKSFWRA
jgi:trk system potassium uptake protein TrkH